MSKPGAEAMDRSARKQHRETVQRAKHLVKEAPRLLKSQRKRVADDAAERITQDVAELKELLAKKREAQPSVLAEAVTRLDRTLDEHLGYARKSVTREYIESIVYAVLIALFIRTFLFEAFKIPTGSMIPTLEVDDHIFVNKFIYGLRIPFTQIRMWQWGDPERGDIIVFEFPKEGDDKGKDFIKRVVAVAGDRVRLVDNVVYVNGEPVPTEVLNAAADCEDQTNKECHCVRQRETVPHTSYITQHRVASQPYPNFRCLTAPDWPLETPEFGVADYFGAKGNNDAWPDVLVPPAHVFVMGDNRDNSSDGRYWGLVPHNTIKGKAFVIWWADDWHRLFNLLH